MHTNLNAAFSLVKFSFEVVVDSVMQRAAAH